MTCSALTGPQAISAYHVFIDYFCAVWVYAFRYVHRHRQIVLLVQISLTLNCTINHFQYLQL